MTTQKTQSMLSSYEVAEIAHKSLDSNSSADNITQTVIDSYGKTVGVDNYGKLPLVTRYVLDLIEFEAPTEQFESNDKQEIQKKVLGLIQNFLNEKGVDNNGEVTM